MGMFFFPATGQGLCSSERVEFVLAKASRFLAMRGGRAGVP